jgi:beta-glucosidase
MIMAAYNGVNGKPLTENELLAEPLKGEWGFDGVVVSDWGAVYNGEPSARAALDLAMPGPEAMWGEPLVEAVQAGRVLEADIDAKVRRLLLLASRVGALGSGAHLSAAGPSGRPEDASPLAREAAAAATVLFRNESILPLEPENLRRIALIGPGARNPRQLGGGSATVFPPYLVTPFAGLTNALAGQANVVAAVGAELGDGLRPMRVDELARDDGADPASVRWLDVQGQVVLAHGSATTLLIRAVPEVPAGTVALELGCRFIPDQDGRWQLGVSGFGAHQLHLNGNKVIDEQWILTGDPHEVFSAPPEHSIGVDLQAGQAVEVLLRYEWTTDADIIFAGLAVAAPRLSDEEELARAVDLARTSDVAVVVVGTSEAVESEGIDRRTMFLPGRQDELVRAVAAVNPRTVVVVNAGAPVEMPWREDVAAILVAWFPGMEFGNALADVLLGTTEPGGRLPTSWPAVAADAPVLGTTPTDGRLVYQEGLEIGHRGYFANGTEPAYWFGHGLGYTTWEYQSIGTPVESSPDRLTATVRLRNTGSRRGKQVVQVYAARPGSAIRRPVRCLAGFASVNVEPGAVADVPVVIDRRVLRHWDVDARAWVIEPGKVLLSTGPHAGDQRVSASMTLLRGTREDT